MSAPSPVKADRRRPAAPSVPPLGRLRTWVARSPVAAFAVVVVAVSAVQFLGTWRLLEFVYRFEAYEPWIQLGINLAIVVPVVTFLFVLPTARSLRQREAAESALRAARDELEVRVHERTAELETSNAQLREEMKRRQRAQESVAFQARLLDAVEQAVAATDEVGRVIYWNRYAETLYGWSAIEVMGRPLRQVVSYRQADGRPLDDIALCPEGSGWSGEAEAQRRDGSRFPAYLVCSCLPGFAEGLVCLSLDISESKAAEQALRESEEKYAKLVESSPTGIFILQDDRLVFVNPKFAELLECERGALADRPFHELLHPEDREKLGGMARALAEGRPVPEECECRLVTHTGQVRWVALRNALIPHQGGSATLGTVQDVTERKRMETKLHQLSARLLTIQEEERRRVAREIHDSVGQTLTGIKFTVEAALGAPWPEERRTGRVRLRALVPAIQGAVEEVRRISAELRPSMLDDLGLLPTIAGHLRQMESLHPKLKVEQQLGALETDIPDALKTPIYRLIQEATNNVVKHSGARRLLVALEVVAGSLRMRVQDDGVGFEPNANGGEGSGLGSMRERAELSGGRLDVVTAPGAGTTVEALWPLSPPVSG